MDSKQFATGSDRKLQFPKFSSLQLEDLLSDIEENLFLDMFIFAREFCYQTKTFLEEWKVV